MGLLYIYITIAIAIFFSSNCKWFDIQGLKFVLL